MITPVEYKDKTVFILNQTLLPHTVEYRKCLTPEEVADAIVKLEVRGAPLIGIAAAYGMLLAVANYSYESQEVLGDYYRRYDAKFRHTRPTAVNLFWALDEMQAVFAQHQGESLADLYLALYQKADQLVTEATENNLKLSENGADLFSQPEVSVLTLCNAGQLATGGQGTALGVVRALAARGQLQQVWSCETRPVLQGARLTVWELTQDHIPVTLITDNMAAHVMKIQPINAIITGADRVAANGDTANKIGTLGLAILANFFKITFYIAAPLSTIDLSIKRGAAIPIENRDASEVRSINGRLITLPHVPVYNPAFDVTPNQLISAIITEAGVIRPPFDQHLSEVI